MDALRKSGAAGAHRDKKKEMKQGKSKHRGKEMEEAYDHPQGGELSRMGRILMDKAVTTKDDALSNVMARVGDELTMYGAPGGARSIEELEKRTKLPKEKIMKLMQWAKSQKDDSLAKVKDPKPDDGSDMDESGIMYRAGVKKYGKDGMSAIQSAAGKGASAEEIGAIKDKHNKKKESYTSETSIGHVDDERHMIRKELYQAAKYAKELFAMLDDLPEDSDFPHWWQSKVTKSLQMLSKAKHYLENELAVPEAVCSECSKPRFVAMPEEIQKQYESVNEEKQKGVDGKVCWKGYKRMGTKKKGGKTVDNCVKM